MKSIARSTLLLIFCAALLGPTAYAQGIEANVQRLSNEVIQARSDNLHLSSPNSFRDASDYLNDAKKKMRKGDKLSDIQRAVQDGHKRLADARRFTDVGGVILEDAFASRNAALEARAPEFAKNHWNDGEESLRDAGEEVEKGDQNDAGEDAKEASAYYRRAEMDAIRSNLLGEARKQNSNAKKAGAQEWARQTWKEAKEKLDKADELLKTDRYNRTESRMLAEEATEQFARARLLAKMARKIDDDVEKNAEKALLQYEGHIGRIAESLGTTVAFGEGPAAVTERLVATVRSDRDDRENLQATLKERRDRIDRLQHVVDSLDSRLATLEKREKNVSSLLQTKREQDQMLKRVRGIFQPNEAEVLTSGDEVIVRMKGLSFPSGSAEIQPKNFGLLTKLQQVIREFSGPITITGHTDAEGNDALNMNLSENRSEAVHQYLMANMSLDADRIQAVGRGESEPIATNETTEGRSQNRRIDVTIGFE